VPLILLVLIVPVVIVLLTPLLLIQRYRVGSSRRPARPWIATVALLSMAISTVFFLITAAFTNIWVPRALIDGLEGLAGGSVLGIIGLLVTRWEPTPRSLHYTPNRWMVLTITLVVAGRVAFGMYRAARTAAAGATGTALLSSFGVAESLAAGGIVIGYYLAYNAGVRWRIARWQRRALRPMND
jgi:hypothetical protein